MLLRQVFLLLFILAIPTAPSIASDTTPILKYDASRQSLFLSHGQTTGDVAVAWNGTDTSFQFIDGKYDMQFDADRKGRLVTIRSLPDGHL